MSDRLEDAKTKVTVRYYTNEAQSLTGDKRITTIARDGRLDVVLMECPLGSRGRPKDPVIVETLASSLTVDETVDFLVKLILAAKAKKAVA